MCSCERFEQAFYEEVGARHTNKEQLFASLSQCRNMKSAVWDEWTRRKEPARQRYTREVLRNLRTLAPFMVLPSALVKFQGGGVWECLEDATKGAMEGMIWQHIDEGDRQWLVPLSAEGLHNDTYKAIVIEFLDACDCAWAFLHEQVEVTIDPKHKKKRMPRLVTGEAVPEVKPEWQQSVRLVCLLREVAEHGGASHVELAIVPPAASLNPQQGDAPVAGLESAVEEAFLRWKPGSTELSHADLRAFAKAKGVQRVKRNSGRKWLCQQILYKLQQEQTADPAAARDSTTQDI